MTAYGPVETLWSWKGERNTQFAFLCNPQESGAPRVCITFPQITQKILTEDIIYWLELVTEILIFLHISYIYCEKSNHSAFLIYQNINNKNYTSGIFWVFKSKLQINHAITYIGLFLPDSNNCFSICLVPYIHICLYYFLILCFYFHLFDTLLTTRHSTTCNVWFDFITSVSELELDLKLNNPKLTLIPLESLFCVL